MWGYLGIPSSRDCVFFLFCTIYVWISIQIPGGMDGLMKHETSARCRASRSVKLSTQSHKAIVRFLWCYAPQSDMCAAVATQSHDVHTMSNISRATGEYCEYVQNILRRVYDVFGRTMLKNPKIMVITLSRFFWIFLFCVYLSSGRVTTDVKGALPISFSVTNHINEQRSYNITTTKQSTAKQCACFMGYNEDVCCLSRACRRYLTHE